MMLLFTVQDLVGEAGVSNSEGNNGAPYLEGLSVLFLHGECVLEEDEGPELGLVVLYIDAIWLVLDDGMRTGD